MDDKQTITNKKSPVGAAVLSALFPGVGFFYIGNFVKGIAYILVMASLIVLQVHGRGHEHVIIALMLGGFYIFQIFDAFDEAQKTESIEKEKGKLLDNQNMSVFVSGVILVLGILFQLANLDILITYRTIVKMWPVLLIVLGAKFIYGYVKDKDKEITEGE